jgi:hypothetical protein
MEEPEWVADVCESLEELKAKIKRGDIIPMTRVEKCSCDGGWCDLCKGKGATVSEAYMNDWNPIPGGDDERE